MPLDPNIILRGQGVQLDNPLDVQNKALTMRQLAQATQRNDQAMADEQALREAYKQNVKVGPDGKATVNRGGLMSQLALGGRGALAVGEQSKLDAQDVAAKELQMRTLTEQTKIAKQLAWSITDPVSYEAARQKGIELGLPNADKLPPQYDPNFVKQMQMGTLTAEEQLGQYWKEKEFRLKKAKAGGAGGKPAPAVPGATVQPGAKPTAEDAKKVKAALIQRNNLLQSINKLDGMVKSNGTEAFSYGNSSTDMAALATDIRMGAKELYELGALSGPDMDLISKTIPDPTDWKWAFTMNSADKVRSALAQAKKIMEDKASNIAEGRGYSAQPYTPKDQDQNVAGAPLKVFKEDEIEWMP